ncbi:uncharacterized protein [Dermacentor albipictus]|uniref:uncharacterized protein isoform X1 n=1 Tax=Dermacentor albipictus TaxID=60249 RepID=UPI0038FC6A15
MVQCARKLAAHVPADTHVSSPPERTGFNVLQENALVFSYRHVTKMGDGPDRGVRICGVTSSLLLLLLLSAVVILSNEVRAASLLEGRQVDAHFWQGVLNKTAEGNMEQAFAMVLGKVSDDLAGATDRMNEFLDGVRRNLTSVIQEGVKNKAGSPAEETRK